MNRQQLAALRDVLDLILRLPASAHAQIAAWLAPEASARPNGRDLHPPPTASTGKGSAQTSADSAQVSELQTDGVSPRRSPTPYAGKARRGRPPTSKTAEQRLLEALQESPGSTVIALARAAGGGRSITGERLRQLARRGLVTKDGAGHWRLVGDLAGEEARPMEALSSS